MNEQDIAQMNRLQIHSGIANYFGVAAADVSKAFSCGQTDHLRSILATGIVGRATEKLSLLTGGAITALGVAMLNPSLLVAAFGAAATFGLYGTQRLSRWRMDQSFHHALKVLEHGRPRPE